MCKRPANKTARMHSRNTLPLVVIGMGLILFGVAAIFLLFDEDQSESAQAQSAGVVPQQVDFLGPELELIDIAGQAVKLTDYLGQVVLLNNWATWCPPCRAEMPVLQAYHNAYQQQGFTVVAVEAGEPAEQVRQFVEETGLTFPVWVDPSQHALAAFRNMALPNSYVIDREGKVRLAWSGAITMEALEKYVTPLVEE